MMADTAALALESDMMSEMTKEDGVRESERGDDEEGSASERKGLCVSYPPRRWSAAIRNDIDRSQCLRLTSSCFGINKIVDTLLATV